MAAAGKPSRRAAATSATASARPRAAGELLRRDAWVSSESRRQLGEGGVSGVVVAVESEIGGGGGEGRLGEGRGGGEKHGEDEEAQRGRLR